MGGKARVSDITERVRQRIRERRLALALTQEQLCEQAQISIDSVSRIENGQRVPSLTTLESIAKALGISVARLVESEQTTAPADSNLAVITHRLRTQPPAVVAAAEQMIAALIAAVTTVQKRD